MAWTNILKKLIGDGTFDEEDAEREYERLRKEKKLPQSAMGGDLDKGSFVERAVVNRPYEEGGEMEGTASDPQKAEMFRVRMDKRRHEGPESEKRYMRSADYEIEKEMIDDKVEKRRAIASTRNLKPGATSEEAMAAIEKAGGLDAYWKSMSMADESERKAFEKKLRRYLDGLDDEDDEVLGSSGTVRMYSKARQEAESAANRAE